MTYARSTRGLLMLCALAFLTHCDGELSLQASSVEEITGEPGEVPLLPGADQGNGTPGEGIDQGSEGEPYPDDPSVTLCPEDDAEVALAPVRRLSRDEYINTLAQHFPSASVEAVELRLAGLSTDSTALDVSPGAFDAYLGRPGESSKLERRVDIARLLAEDVASHPERLRQIAPPCMQDLRSVEGICVREFVAAFGAKLLKRELREGEVEEFAKMWALDDASLDTPARRFEVMIASIITDPEFLFHIPALSDSATGTLSQETIASRLSYAVSGQAPDEELMRAARAGELVDADVRRTHAARLLDSEAGRAHVGQIFAQWLALDRAVDLEPAGVRVGVDINGLYDDMREETERFIEHVIFKERGSYLDLMTSPLDFPTNDTLAHLMGHEASASGGVESTTGRAGLMARPAILVHVEPRVSPIHRGVHIMYRFLCSELKLDPNVNVNEVADAKIDDLGARVEEMSSREIAAFQTADTACATCHTYINPFGFALSGYGPLGDSWEEEHIYDANGVLLNTVAVDASTALSLDGTTFEVHDASTYGRAVAESKDGRACMATQIFRVTHKREPAQSDDCHMRRLEHGLDEDRPLFDVLVDNAALEAIKTPTK